MDAPSAPLLTEQTSPGPGVEIYFPTLHAEVNTITVWRIADGQREEVRTAVRAVASGDFHVSDWEVPFGIPVTYVAEVFDADGASLTGAQGEIQVDRDLVHISNPLDPQQVYVIPSMQFGSNSFARLASTRDRKLVYVVGVPRPFAQDWGKGALEQVPFSVTTDTVGEAQALVEMLEAPQLLIRTPPEPFSIVPRLLYASVQTPTANPRDWVADGASILWQLTLDEVQPIAKAIMRPLVTWADWEAAFEGATWNDVMAVYGGGTWTDWVRSSPHA